MHTRHICREWTLIGPARVKMCDGIGIMCILVETRFWRESSAVNSNDRQLLYIVVIYSSLLYFGY